MKKLVLYLNFEDCIFEYHLPAINDRRYQLYMSEFSDEYTFPLNFEVWDNVWYLRDNDYVITDSDDKKIEANSVVSVTVKEEDYAFSIIIHEVDHSITEFTKYNIGDISSISIGKENTNEIVIYNEYVSEQHALIIKQGEQYYLEDFSSNGTYLNGNRVLSRTPLDFSDEIYIVGVKMVFLGDILAINHSQYVDTTLNAFVPIPPPEDVSIEKNIVDSYFSRSPRNMEPFDTEKIEVEGPPSPQRSSQQPLLFLIGPSVTMPIPILLSVMISMRLSSGSGFYIGTLISVLCSAGIGAMWALMHRNYNKKEEIKKEKERVEGYQKYIEDNTVLLEEKHGYNKSLLEKHFLDTRSLTRITSEHIANLWDRNINHEDFLTIRLGVGKVPFQAELHVPKERFSLVKDEMTELPRNLYEKYKNLDSAVSTISLKDNNLIGVIGDHNSIMDLARTMIVQISALHCYSDVKIAFLTNPKDRKEIEWIKWLPHVFSDDKKLRYIADDPSTYQNVLYGLTGELRSREENETDKKILQHSPHYIVFCTEAEIIEKEAIFSYITSNKKLGFTFVLLYGQMDRLPNECLQIIQFEQNGFSGRYALNESRNETNDITFDHVEKYEVLSYAQSISDIYVNESDVGEIPGSIDFLEMLQIGRLEHWDLIKHYKENRVYEDIKAMIGLSHGNRPMYLDIHEKKHGPHGLIAGTTGSGKSETIMTFILSLAMNYHPDEVAFVLIDYKGGGMATPFIGMPHTAGTITNIGSDDDLDSIDESVTRRALVSIKSEIKRRQIIFRKYNVNHIDSYIRMYREGKVEDPLPHLIIISDEFAELKKEQPDFIKELVSTARVGRSLGIHLILATQKPSGVVDDEIWSNSRFKICLRVQDKQDSQEMLKRPEAAYITGIGRAYLQIGNNEIFEMFQSGYAGAPYIPNDELVLSQHNEVSMIGLDGNRLVYKVLSVDKNAVSQLEACINYIKNIAEANHIAKVRPLWLPPLEGKMFLQDIIKTYNIEDSNGLIAMVGLIDQPHIQKQKPFLININKITNILISGNIGMGKSTLLQTMLYSLVTRYSPEEVNIYCMDFSSRTLKLFGSLPHCGGIAFSEEEEKVERMLDLIVSKMDERRKLLDQAGVGSFLEYRKTDQLPTILICIDNYVMFRELYESHEEIIKHILRDGAKYGIEVIVTISGMSDISYKMKQYFSLCIPLYMGERTNYIDALGMSPEFIPSRIQGRGLIVDGVVSEFQIALATRGDTEADRNEVIKKDFEKISKKYDGTKISEIKTIPREQTYVDFVRDDEDYSKIPLGYNVKTIEKEVISLPKIFCYCISAYEESSSIEFIKNLKYILEKRNEKIICVQNTPTKEENCYSTTEYQDGYDLALYLKNEFYERSRAILEKKDMDENSLEAFVAKKYGRLFVLIDDLGMFIDQLYQATEQESLFPIFESFFTQGKGMGIYFIAVTKASDYYSITSKKTGRLFMDYGTGLHFGGHMDSQKLFDFPQTMSEQMKAKEMNMASYMEQGEYKEVYVPLMQYTEGNNG